MRQKLIQEIRAARPHLKNVSPVSYWFIMLMGAFNLFIGLAFLFAINPNTDDPAFRAVTSVIPFGTWSILFIIVGLIKLWAIAVNNWRASRWSLLMGVAIKSGWAVALIVRTFYQADNAFLAATWLALAIAQMTIYIYFLPPTEPRLPDGEVSR